MQTSQYTVVLDYTLDDQLERLLSPMDEIVFLTQLRNELPLVHRPGKRLWRRWMPSKSLRIYRGLSAWCYIHFLYVEHDNHLHILRFEQACKDDRGNTDVVFGDPDEECIRELTPDEVSYHVERAASAMQDFDADPIPF